MRFLARGLSLSPASSPASSGLSLSPGSAPGSALAVCLFFVSLATLVSADEPLLKPNDRVAILGGTFVERMQSSGSFEAELQCRRPDWKLTFRNLGWSGDDVHGIARKRFDGPEDGFQRLLSDVETADPTVVLVSYGFAEASDGEPAVSKFEAGLRRLVDELEQPNRRVILMTPVAMPGFRVSRYDHWIGECRSIVQRIASERKLPVIAIDWIPTAASLTEDRLLPNSAGYGEFAVAAAESLVGGAACGQPRDKLRQLVSRKNQLFFHRYRPQNETYLFLFRKHEQGNNAKEIAQFDPLIRLADEAIWQAAGS